MAGTRQAGDLSLEACLAAFFAPEEVAWECPAEKEARRQAATNGLVTPDKDQRLPVTRSVSFSGASTPVPSPFMSGSCMAWVICGACTARAFPLPQVPRDR